MIPTLPGSIEYANIHTVLKGLQLPTKTPASRPMSPSRPRPAVPFPSQRFSRRLSLLATAAVLVIAAAAAVVASWQVNRQTRQALVDQGLMLAGSMAEQSRPALMSGVAREAREAILTALAFPEVRRVDIHYADGRLLLSSDRREGSDRSPAAADLEQPRLADETEDSWRFVAPVRGVESNADAPMTTPRELLGYVSVVQGKAPLSKHLGQLIALSIGVGLAFAVLFLGLLRVVTRHLARPLNELATVMEGAQSGRRGLRAGLAGSQDVAHIAQAFNSMMEALEEREHDLEQKHQQLQQHAATLEQRVGERTLALSVANNELRRALDSLKAAQESLVAAEKQASLGRLVAGVAHELNTPLGNSVTVLSSLDEEYRAVAELLDSGRIKRSDLANLVTRSQQGHALLARSLQRAAAIVHDFKQIAVDQTSEKRRTFDLAEVVSEVIGSVQPSFKPTPHRIEAALEGDIAMDSYPGPIGQVITNIALNALLHAFPEGSAGTLWIECRRLGEYQAQLVLHDDGVGMDDEILRHIYDPFFTTKFGQGGSGLGMHIVHGIVTNVLGGSIDIDSTPGHGSAFTVTFPRVAPLAESAD